jgi:hypothetical protein
MAKDLHIAIKEINPNAEFGIADDDVNKITWVNGTTPIPANQILAKAEEIKIRDAHLYPRHKAYPSIQKQLDMQYWDKINDTNTWEQTITAVKLKYPKS